MHADGTAIAPVLSTAPSTAEQHWYAAYTFSHHERRVAAELERRSVNSYLPVYHSVRHWKDRRVKLALPLFPGYVFVRVALCDKLRVLQVPGVANLVSFGGVPAALPDDQIEILRAGLTAQLQAEPNPYLTVGRRVTVKSGPLAGMQGIIVRKKNSTRLVISFDLIMRSLSVEVSEADLAPVLKKPKHADYDTTPPGPARIVCDK